MDKKLCALSVKVDFAERNRASMISVRLLDPSSSRSIYSSRLCGNIFQGAAKMI